MDNEEMMTRVSWQEFQATGLLWFINTILHMFGYVIAYNVDDQGNMTEVFPARCKFRGFTPEINTEGYIKVSEYLRRNINDLVKEANS